MWRVRVTSPMSSARRNVSAYVSREKGASPSGRWQLTQLAKTIGATSLLNVAGDGGVGPQPLPAIAAAATPAANRRTNALTPARWRRQAPRRPPSSASRAARAHVRQASRPPCRRACRGRATSSSPARSPWGLPSGRRSLAIEETRRRSDGVSRQEDTLAAGRQAQKKDRAAHRRGPVQRD